jgi:hypothetical protein
MERLLADLAQNALAALGGEARDIVMDAATMGTTLM